MGNTLVFVGVFLVCWFFALREDSCLQQKREKPTELRAPVEGRRRTVAGVGKDWEDPANRPRATSFDDTLWLKTHNVEPTMTLKKKFFRSINNISMLEMKWNRENRRNKEKRGRKRKVWNKESQAGERRVVWNVSGVGRPGTEGLSACTSGRSGPEAACKHLATGGRR